jgi:hypothetical protein
MRRTHGRERVKMCLQLGQRALQRDGKPRVLAVCERIERQPAHPSAQRQRLVARAGPGGT